MIYYTILYYAILYSTILYYTILYYTIRYSDYLKCCPNPWRKKTPPKSLPMFVPLGVVVRFRTVVANNKLTLRPYGQQLLKSFEKAWNTHCRRILGSDTASFRTKSPQAKNH